MPANRNLLALNKIDEFAAWAEAQGFVRSDVVGEYEVLRLKRPGDQHTLIWYRREGGNHATCQWKKAGSADPSALVRVWLRSRGVKFYGESAKHRRSDEQEITP